MLNKTYTYKNKFTLECGATLPGLTIAYSTQGRLNSRRDNVIYVCHALTANSDVALWWPGMVGKGMVFDTGKYLVICANVLGSCYGTTGPGSINPKTKQPYSKNFPPVTIRDIVKVHQLLAEHLQLRSIHLLCGGSLGGQQVQEWAIMQPAFIRNIFAIATNPRHSAWGIAFNEAQRMAIEAGENGLEAARAIAMLSYRNYKMFENTQTDMEDKTDGFRAASYQRYQGLKLKNRFDANSYVLLSKAMDSHNVGRGRNSMQEALAGIKAKALIVGITSDLLFPTFEQKFLADNIPGALYREIDSPYGHDGFLIESAMLSELLRRDLKI